MRGMKTGGRKRGTPNRSSCAITPYLQALSVEYFRPREELGGKSQCEMDLGQMTATERANAELKLAEFHTPKRKAVDVDMNADVKVRTIEDKLRALCGDDAYEDDEDDGG